MLSDNNKNLLFKLSIKKYPEECCAFILKDGSFIELENIYEGDKKECFQVSPYEYIKYADQISLICHSHNNFDFTPSLRDMNCQIKSSVPWVIVATNGVDCKYCIFGDMIINNEWLGLEFVHGVKDCYSLIKNWFYHHKKVLLPEFPRSSHWWEHNNESMYEKYFNYAGFIDKELNKNIEIGDVIMFKLAKSKVINHAAVYCGNGLFAHHILGKLSILERLDRYINSHEIEKRLVTYDEKSNISRRNADNFRRAILL